MLDFINPATDGREWERKVFDEGIVGRWKKEAVSLNESLPEKADQRPSEQIFEVCLLES